MAIAEVIDVRNSVFINKRPALKGQMVSYGNLIETYNINIGLLKSKLSSDPNDDGMLTIEFIEKRESMKIKPHCKVIFQVGDRGLWAGPNTVGLNKESRVAGRPTNSLQLGTLTLPLGPNILLNFQKAKVNSKIFSGDIIKIGSKSRVEITTKKGEKIRVGPEMEFLASTETFDKAKKVGLSLWKKDQGWLDTLKDVFTEDEPANTRYPTQVLAIAG